MRRWSKSKIETSLAAIDTLPSDTVFLDPERTPGELAETVLARMSEVAGA